MDSEFDDMGEGSWCCQHCGENVEVDEKDVHEATGWWTCPECGETNTGD